MDNKRIFEKLEVIDTRLDRIDITQAEQAKDLKHHITRTDKLQSMVEPIYIRHQQVIGALKLITLLGVIFGIIKGIESLL